MKFEILNRFSGKVQFVAEIECEESLPTYIKLGFAVKLGVKNKADLSGADLRRANLSEADLSGADLRRANLSEANLSEANLSEADLSGADLSGADLRRANLSGADLRRADLRRANLSEANLSEANLSEADLSGADLSGADLRRANLNGADLSGANLNGADLSGEEWMPKINNIHQSIYNACIVEGALNMQSWHCGTAHCRAGWVVTLAGEGGKVLEGIYGTSAAAALIYANSDKDLEKTPDFHCDNDTALADIERLAKLEQSK